MVRQTRMGRARDARPSPVATAGTTTHANRPIGSAAAAQMAKIARRLYWVIWTPLGWAGADIPGIAGRCVSRLVVKTAPLYAGLATTMTGRAGGVVWLTAVCNGRVYIPGCTSSSTWGRRQPVSCSVPSLGVGARAIGATTTELVRHTPLWCIDAVLAVCFVVTGLTTTGRADAGYVPRDAFATVLILAATVPYFARRLAPLPVFAVSGAALATLIARGNAGGALPMAIAVGAYTVAAYRPWREVAGCAALVRAAVGGVVDGSKPGLHPPPV